MRSLQITFLLKEGKPVISPKFFEQRFAKIENGEITKLIRDITSRIDMNEIYKKTLKTALKFDVTQSEKFKA